MNEMRRKRVQSPKTEEYGEANKVVKGTARRIVIVKSPDKRIFEEAIFIVREDYLHTAGITQSQLMKEAQEAAHGYMGGLKATSKKRSGRGFAMTLSALFGSGAAFAVMKLFGI